jgi:hypothetical protein
MALSEKLNAISRFSIYLGTLLFIYLQDYLVLYIPIITMGLLFLVYQNREKMDIDPRLKKQKLKVGELEEEIEQFQNNVQVDENGDLCQKPTRENPFMNVLLTDYVDNPNRPKPCSLDNEEVKEEIENEFNFNLYKDVNDVWQRNNSQMKYHTVPGSTIPNDRDSFMKWCWNIPYVCKDGDLEACNRYAGLGDGHQHGKIV